LDSTIGPTRAPSAPAAAGSDDFEAPHMFDDGEDSEVFSDLEF
jgi:hypothetical protein